MNRTGKFALEVIDWYVWTILYHHMYLNRPLIFFNYEGFFTRQVIGHLYCTETCTLKVDFYHKNQFMT